MAWNEIGRYLAVRGADIQQSGKNVCVYSWNGTTLARTPNSTIPKTTMGWCGALSWTPDSKYLAVGGALCGTFTTTGTGTPLFVYAWDGTSLTQTFSQGCYGNLTSRNDCSVYDCSWSPDGNYLAVGTYAYKKPIIVYKRLYDGYLREWYTVPNTNFTQVYFVDWHPTGNYLAASTIDASTVHPNDLSDLHLYSWNYTALTLTNSLFNGGSNNARYCRWTHDGKYLTVSSNRGNNDLRVYQLGYNELTQTFTSSLTLTYSQRFGTNVSGTDWSADDNYLAAYGSYGTKNLIVYKRRGAVDGVKNNMTFNNTLYFNDGGQVTGDVKFKNGINVTGDQTLILDTTRPIEGPITLLGNATLELRNNIHFGASATLTTTLARVKGNGKTIFLDNNLSLTLNNTVIHFSTDTTIDGQGHSLTLGRWNQLFVDSNSTLTLKNMTVLNTLNNAGFPPIKCSATTSKLAFDNVTLNPINDFYFSQGHLFIHNDVTFTGTSALVYASTVQSYITPQSTLAFDPGTSFSYAPATASNNLFLLDDASSKLSLDGSSLLATNTGLRLTKGQLYFDNNVTLNSQLQHQVKYIQNLSWHHLNRIRPIFMLLVSRWNTYCCR